MIASASLASSPASFSTQFAFLCTISRISGSLASSARAVQRIAASSIGTWRSSLIAEASAWPSSGETSILRRREAIAPLTIPPSRSSSRLSKMSAIRREAPARMRVPFARRRLQEAAGGAGDVDVAHPPRDDRRDQEILLEEVGERFADAVLVARDDRGVRDRQAERMAEQGGDREPVGEAADHRRLGERLHVAEPGIVRLERAGDDEHRRHHDQQAGGGDLHARGAGLRGVEAGRERRWSSRSCRLNSRAGPRFTPPVHSRRNGRAASMRFGADEAVEQLADPRSRSRSRSRNRPAPAAASAASRRSGRRSR